MAELADLFGAALTDLYPPPSSDLSAAANVEILVRATGSGRAAARYLGVAESTLRGWRKGVQPKGDRPQAIAAAARAATVDRKLLADVKAGHATLAITARDVASSADVRRERTIYPGRYIPKGTMQRIVRMWERAEPDDKLEAAIMRAIDRYYTPLAWSQVTAVTFE